MVLFRVAVPACFAGCVLVAGLRFWRFSCLLCYWIGVVAGWAIWLFTRVVGGLVVLVGFDCDVGALHVGLSLFLVVCFGCLFLVSSAAFC